MPWWLSILPSLGRFWNFRLHKRRGYRRGTGRTRGISWSFSSTLKKRWESKRFVIPSPLKNKKQICTPQIEDWYSIKLSDLEELGFPTSFRKSDLVDLLNERYPGHEWEKANLLQGRFGQQKKLERAIASLFPVSLPLTNYNSKSNWPSYERTRQWKRMCDRRRGWSILLRDRSWNWIFGFPLSIWHLNIRSVYGSTFKSGLLMYEYIGHPSLQKRWLCSCLVI